MYTGLISVVKTSISGWHHFGFKITQTSVFVNFLKTISDGSWSLNVHKNTKASAVEYSVEELAEYSASKIFSWCADLAPSRRLQLI